MSKIRTGISENGGFVNGIAMSLRVIALAVCLLAAIAPSPPFAQGQNVELVGSIGGSVRAVAVQDGYVYIGQGLHLTIVDVSDASAPEVRGSLRLPDLVWDVADSEGGLAIIRYTGPIPPPR